MDGISGTAYGLASLVWQEDADAYVARNAPGTPFPDLTALYQDDEHILGLMPTCAARAAAVVDTGPRVGGFSKEAKWLCVVRDAEEIVEAKAWFGPFGLPDSAYLPYDNGGEILGGAFGPADVREERVRRDLAKQSRKNEAIARLDHRHAAFACLVSTGTSCVANHAARTAAVHPSTFAEYDAHTLALVSDVTGIERTRLNDAVLASRPRDGGMGVRPAAPYADAAFVASMLESEHLQRRLAPSLPPVREDAEFIAAWQRLRDGYPTLEEASLSPSSQVADRVTKLQRRLSEPITAKRLEQRDALVPSVSARARLRSAGACASWQVPHPTAADRPGDVWLYNRTFLWAMALRVGGSVQDGDHPCHLCRGASVADAAGVHTLGCVGGGARTRMHTALKNDIFTLAARATLAPRLEPGVGTEGRRADVALYLPPRGTEASTLLLDVATTSPLADPRRAAETPGGAADHYAERKLASYRGVEIPHGARVLPVVRDMLGAFGRDARVVLRRIIQRTAELSGESYARQSARTWGWLQVRFWRELSVLLALNACSLDDSEAPLVPRRA